MKNLVKFLTQIKKESDKITKLLERYCVALLIADNNYEFLKGYLGF